MTSEKNGGKSRLDSPSSFLSQQWLVGFNEDTMFDLTTEGSQLFKRGSKKSGQEADAAFQAQQLAFLNSRIQQVGAPLFSSVGDGPPTPPPPNDNDGDGGVDGWDDFLNPKKESENLRKARDFLSEQSLPISFDENELSEEDEMPETSKETFKGNENSSALVGPSGIPGRGALINGPSAEALANNPYMQVVSKLSPSELISKFTASANPRVQDAVRNTILGLIGSLPKMAFDTTTITTGQRLASLMFQLQMTGYMFKNADYRLSVSQSLGMESEYGQRLLSGSKDLDGPLPVGGKVKGKLKLRYGNNSIASNVGDKEDSKNETPGVQVEVDAAAYMSELRSEVKQLRDELMRTQQSKEDEIRKDLLLYIRTLPEQQLRALTDTMSPDVLVAMKGLVAAVLDGIGDGQIAANTVTEQSGEAMAQLCMWQLVVGYNLRELEVREEMKKNLLNGFSSNKVGGIDYSEPGTLD